MQQHAETTTQHADIVSQMPARERWLTTVEHAQRAARFGLSIEISGDARPVSLAERLDRLVPAGAEIRYDVTGLAPVSP